MLASKPGSCSYLLLLSPTRLWIMKTRKISTKLQGRCEEANFKFEHSIDEMIEII